MEENFNNQNRARRRCPLPVSFKGNLSNLIAAFADTAVLCLCYTLTLISVRPVWEFWPEPEPDCYDLAGTGFGTGTGSPS